MDLSGSVALVTGASRGIGREIALVFARAGTDAIVAYHERADEAEDVAAEIRSVGRSALVLQVDVAQRESVQHMVRETLKAFGRIDLLVNNAGLLQQKPFLSITDEDWDRVLGVNLRGCFLCAQEVFPVMDEQGGGRIINITSSGAQLGGPLAVHYSASKGGVISLTRSLARLGAPRIAVNCIAPGLIETEMTREEVESAAGEAKIRQTLLKRPGTAAEVAETALFLASAASYVTGQTINVNGGLYLG